MIFDRDAGTVVAVEVEDMRWSGGAWEIHRRWIHGTVRVERTVRR
jgi:hypothetical protein